MGKEVIMQYLEYICSAYSVVIISLSLYVLWLYIDNQKIKAQLLKYLDERS